MLVFLTVIQLLVITSKTGFLLMWSSMKNWKQICSAWLQRLPTPEQVGHKNNLTRSGFHNQIN